MKFESVLFFLEMLYNSHLIIKLVLIAIVMDCVFGCVRAFKYKKINSSIGIDGIIRKSCMMASMAFFVVIDYMLGINLIDILVKIVPEKVFDYIPIANAGLTELFGLLFLAYESMSVLKNMNTCNLPVRRLWMWCDGFLRKYTDELPDTTLEENVAQIATEINAISRSLNIKE